MVYLVVECVVVCVDFLVYGFGDEVDYCCGGGCDDVVEDWVVGYLVWCIWEWVLCGDVGVVVVV